MVWKLTMDDSIWNHTCVAVVPWKKSNLASMVETLITNVHIPETTSGVQALFPDASYDIARRARRAAELRKSEAK